MARAWNRIILMAMPATLEKHLGNYVLIDSLGGRTQGSFFKARCVTRQVPNVDYGELVALKRFCQSGAEAPDRTVERDAEVLRRLQHPNIVSHKDSFRAQTD